MAWPLSAIRGGFYQMRVVQKARMFLFGAGLVLLSFCALAYVSGRFEARMAVTRFKADVSKAELSRFSEQGTLSDTDMRLWSDKRIRDYEATLAKGFEPPLALLRVPRMRLEVPVYDGTDDMTLNRGVGRIIGTARPGEEGNIGIAGHRDGFFRQLKDIRLADALELMTRSGVRSYVVDSVRIVSRDDVTVLRTGDTPSMT